MQVVNVAEVEGLERHSPKGKFGRSTRRLSVALGREETSTDLLKRHPFDVAVATIPPSKSLCPYHSHSAQWEFYQVISGRGSVRDAGGRTPVEPGDAFLFKPGEAHEIINDGTEDLVYYVIADNPFGESCHYPDSGKWCAYSPEYRMMRSENLDYGDGEE